MEAWQHVWHLGFAPLFSTPGLQALRDGLANDDLSLLQGATTQPPPMETLRDWPCEAACAVSYTAWKGDGLISVGEVEEGFAAACYQCDQAVGESGACRHFLNWFDDTPRDEMIRQLLPEVEKSLLGRLANELSPL